MYVNKLPVCVLSCMQLINLGYSIARYIRIANVPIATMYVCMYIYVCVCVHACVRACVCVCDQICKKGSYTCTTSMHRFCHHSIATPMYYPCMCVLLPTVRQSAFPRAAF